jgi:DNA polymerase III alpha subunit
LRPEGRIRTLAICIIRRGADILIAGEFSTIDTAALAGQPHNTMVAIAGVVTTLRIRQTKKGEQMPRLTLTGGTGAIECAIFPNAYARLGQLEPPRRRLTPGRRGAVYARRHKRRSASHHNGCRRLSGSRGRGAQPGSFSLRTG